MEKIVSRPLDSMIKTDSRDTPAAAVQPARKLTARQQAWLDENRSAIEAYNRYVETHEDPLEEFRRF